MSKHYTDYKKFILNEKRIPRTNIKIKRLYEIQLYKKVDDTIRRGYEGNPYLVFVVGIHNGLIHTLKLNDIDPDDFFTFIKGMKKSNLNMNEVNQLDSVLRRTEPTGKVFFDSYIKKSTLYKNNKNIYRVFKESGIQYMTELELKEVTYKRILEIKD
jgi:hypothetical protein